MPFYYLRLALRHLWLKRVYSSVIILSLAIGFACTALLLSFVAVELRTDSFHTKAPRIVQLFSEDPFEHNGDMPYVTTQTIGYLRGNYPEVESAVQVGTIDLKGLSTADVTLDQVGLLSVDHTFFDLFDYPLYAGTPGNALTPESIVISREKAVALFGHDRPLGEVVILQTADTARTLVISGVLDEFPENSHLHFDALICHSVLKHRFLGGATYLLLNSATATNALIKKMNKDSKLPGLMGDGNLKYSAEPLKQSYFNSANKMTFMRTRSLTFIQTASLVCGLILFMAAFNFSSLYLLSLKERRKEVGIRKTLGVTLWRLVKPLTTEIGLYVAIALFFAAGLMLFALPYFNGILDTSVSMNYVARWDLVGMAAGIVFVIGMLVIGFSLVQNHRVKPVSLMRATTGTSVDINKFLFTVQFVISITLAVCAVTIIRQMHYLETAPLGFNRHLVVLQADRMQAPKLPALKNELLQLPDIKHVSISNGSPITGNWMVRYDLEDGKSYSPRLFSGDEDLVKTLDLQLIEGELPTVSKKGKVINEAMVRMFDMKDPIGKLIPGSKDEIIGVVKDFTATSFKDETQPAIISYSSDNSKMLIDYSGSSLADLLPKLEGSWKKIYPGEYLNYRIIQEELMKKYKNDTFLYKTVVAYSVVSMVISGFGLFALSWAVAQSRMKEVGIRKVLGANARDIAQLLTTSFVRRIAVAFLIAAPISYYLMNVWLHQFVQRIPLDVTTFALAAVIVTVVAFATMSFQTLRAALHNPVDDLTQD